MAEASSLRCRVLSVLCYPASRLVSLSDGAEGGAKDEKMVRISFKNTVKVE